MYDFKQLSPADFEDLTRDLLQKEWGARLEVFKTGRDGGIDLRCARADGGKTVVQCKHFAGSGLGKLLSHLRREEAPKVARLAPARYVLVTSVPLSPANKAEIREALRPHVRADSDVLGAGDLNNLLVRHPDIEQSNFKLWLSSSAVLHRVLHNAELVQAEFEVDRVRRKLPLYVQNAAYPEATDILTRERVVVISGVPGIGKTTLADLLLFAHLEQGYEPVVIKSEIAEAKRLFNKGRKQVFYYDDFLGQTFLGTRSDFLGRREDGAILDFVDLVARSQSSRFILTTREHLLQRALGISERFAREAALFAGRRCVLDMGRYGLLERGRILYNHIYFSDLTPDHRLQLLAGGFYLHVLQHRNFNPRLVEWLSKLHNVQHAPAAEYQKVVLGVLERPSQLWRVAFEQQVSEASRAMLLTLYTFGGSASLEHDLRPAWGALHRHRATRYNLTTAAEDWRNSLQELEGGFLALTPGRAEFVNPSVKDFFDETLCTHPEHALDLLASAERFRPVGEVWALAASEKGEALKQQLATDATPLLRALERVLPRPSTSAIPAARGGISVYRVDTPPEKRLLAVVQMASALRSEPLRAIAEGYAGEVARDWQRWGPDYEALVGVLSHLDENARGLWSGSRMHGDLKALVLATLNDAAHSIDGFCSLAEYVRGSATRLLPSEREALADAFGDYLEWSFSDEMSNTQGETGLQEFGGKLRAVGEWLGINVRPQQSDIDELLEELGRQEEAQGDELKDWTPQDGWRKGKDDEQEVRRLFDGLADDAR